MKLNQPRRLTSLQGKCLCAAFSPDGGRVAFTCIVKRRADIYVVNIDGTELIKLTRGGTTAGEAAYYTPRFSPDGQMIVCSRADAFHEEYNDIVIMQADGSDLRQLTHTRQDSDARFGQDGQRIFFVSSRHEQTEIFCINREGGEQTRLTYTTQEPAHPSWWRPRSMHPVCSPNGEWIVFSSSLYGLPKDNRFEIARMRPDGSEQQRLTQTSGSSSYPVVSPDSQHIAFTSWGEVGEKRKGKSDMYAVSIDGSGLQCLEESPFVNWLGSFSADGRYLAFDSTRGGSSSDITRNWDIYLRDMTNGAILRVTNNAFLDRKPLFSPDGRCLVFESDRDGTQELYIIDSLNQTWADEQ